MSSKLRLDIKSETIRYITFLFDIVLPQLSEFSTARKVIQSTLGDFFTLIPVPDIVVFFI